ARTGASRWSGADALRPAVASAPPKKGTEQKVRNVPGGVRRRAPISGVGEKPLLPPAWRRHDEAAVGSTAARLVGLSRPCQLVRIVSTKTSASKGARSSGP